MKIKQTGAAKYPQHCGIFIGSARRSSWKRRVATLGRRKRNVRSRNLLNVSLHRGHDPSSLIDTSRGMTCVRRWEQSCKNVRKLLLAFDARSHVKHCRRSLFEDNW